MPTQPDPVAATVPYVATRFPPVYIRLRMDADGDDISAWLDKARTSIREALEAMGVEVIEEDDDA